LCTNAQKGGAEMYLESETRRLESELSKRLVEHHMLEIAELEVRVRGTVAFVKGTVPNMKQKRLAGQVAGQVEGIREVVNMLRITPLPIIDDGSLEKRLTRALARNPNVDNSKISVEVSNGIVFLKGFANTAAEKRLAEQEVWAAAGVIDIINKVEVLSERPRSDVEIAGEILRSFSQCLGLDLSKVTVEVKDGTAHLCGAVPTDYLKDTAEELATWVPSIARVVNELKVIEIPGFGKYAPTGLVRLHVEQSSRNEQVIDSRSLAANAMRSAGQLRSTLNAKKKVAQG